MDVNTTERDPKILELKIDALEIMSSAIIYDCGGEGDCGPFCVEAAFDLERGSARIKIDKDQDLKRQFWTEGHFKSAAEIFDTTFYIYNPNQVRGKIKPDSDITMIGNGSKKVYLIGGTPYWAHYVLAYPNELNYELSKRISIF